MGFFEMFRLPKKNVDEDFDKIVDEQEARAMRQASNDYRSELNRIKEQSIFNQPDQKKSA